MPMSSPLAARLRSDERLTRACVGESVVMRRYYDDIASNSSAVMVLALSFFENSKLAISLG